MRQPSGRSEGKKRKRHKAAPLQTDREAVRAVVSREAFQRIEAIRAEIARDGDPEELFWRMAREEMVRIARPHSDFGEKIMRAKTGTVGAMLGLPPEHIDRLLGQVDFPAFVEAALRNAAILEFQKEPKIRDLWTEETIRQSPPLRVEFEHAVVFGRVNEGGDIAKNKNWGPLVALKPLRPDDRLYPSNVSYILKPTSKQRMRWEFRDTFRNILGNNRSLVSEALRSNKKWFLGHLDPTDTRIIRDRLDIEPGEFWRMVRYGERFGPDGILRFVRTLEEKTKGYLLPFSEAETLVQIQPAPMIAQDSGILAAQNTQ